MANINQLDTASPADDSVTVNAIVNAFETAMKGTVLIPEAPQWPERRHQLMCSLNLTPEQVRMIEGRIFLGMVSTDYLFNDLEFELAGFIDEEVANG